MTTRKEIFDAIKAARGGRSFMPGEVKSLDALLNALGVPGDEPDTPWYGHGGAELGALSERFESGGRGVGAVSSGKGDPGGVSYGVWQLASKTGTCKKFVEAEGAPWRDLFNGNPPGSPEFSAAWKTTAANEPDKFRAAQHTFIKRTHYDPAVKGVREETGFDLDAAHPAVRDAAWSVSVQHGGAVKILSRAVRQAGELGPKALVNAIYDVRSEYVLAVGKNSGSQTTLNTMRSIVENRYKEERRDALAMIG